MTPSPIPGDTGTRSPPHEKQTPPPLPPLQNLPARMRTGSLPDLHHGLCQQQRTTAKQIPRRQHPRGHRPTSQRYAAMPPRTDIQDELDQAEQKAWESLSRYKFLMFGYWCGIWVHLNRIAGSNRPNPWRDLVHMARSHTIDSQIPAPAQAALDIRAPYQLCHHENQGIS